MNTSNIEYKYEIWNYHDNSSDDSLSPQEIVLTPPPSPHIDEIKQIKCTQWIINQIHKVIFW